MGGGRRTLTGGSGEHAVVDRVRPGLAQGERGPPLRAQLLRLFAVGL